MGGRAQHSRKVVEVHGDLPFFLASSFIGWFSNPTHPPGLEFPSPAAKKRKDLHITNRREQQTKAEANRNQN
jgi:hypothetical protein